MTSDKLMTVIGEIFGGYDYNHNSHVNDVTCLVTTDKQFWIMNVKNSRTSGNS